MSNKTQKCAEKVTEVAASQIEDIRLMLCPDEDDAKLNGTTILLGDIEYEVTEDDVNSWREEDGCMSETAIACLIGTHWEEIREQAYDRFHEYALSFDYIEATDDHSGYFCYLISTGGPGTEIRFYADPGFHLHKAEFWNFDWFDGAHKVVTRDPTIEALWEILRECSAEHTYRQACGNE